jgi:hypothetical protein
MNIGSVSYNLLKQLVDSNAGAIKPLNTCSVIENRFGSELGLSDQANSTLTHCVAD